MAELLTRLKDERRGLLAWLEEAQQDNSRCREDIARQYLRENALKIMQLEGQMAKRR